MQTQFPPAAQDALAAVAAVDLVKVYGSGDTAVRALDGVTVGFTRAQFTAIMGPSGSGKSTLMHCLAGLDTAAFLDIDNCHSPWRSRANPGLPARLQISGRLDGRIGGSAGFYGHGRNAAFDLRLHHLRNFDPIPTG